MAVIMECARVCGAAGALGEQVCQRRRHRGQGRPRGFLGPRHSEGDALISRAVRPPLKTSAGLALMVTPAVEGQHVFAPTTLPTTPTHTPPTATTITPTTTTTPPTITLPTTTTTPHHHHHLHPPQT
ncbi:unnamed protein product [Merluccius merluccius]